MHEHLDATGRCICSINGQCAGCTRHLELKDYAGQELLIPAWGYVDGISICRDRRSGGTPRPAAVCAADGAPVCAAAHVETTSGRA
jgi:hypothetical protein